MKTFRIRYIFRFPDNRQEAIDLHLDAETLNLVNDLPENLPSWTHLNFHQCPNCLLSAQNITHCPIAAHLVNPMVICKNVISHQPIYMEVVTTERIISKDTTAQKAISSLMGLIMATSGCPHTSFFKPMARFHLPFANTQETLYRAVSMYLFAQFFLWKKGKPVDFELAGLAEIYWNVAVINRAFSERLLAVSEKDAAINALINLDVFAQMFFFAMKDSLEEVQYLFKPYFSVLEKNEKNHDKDA
jgi:hypothetical protein